MLSKSVKGDNAVFFLLLRKMLLDFAHEYDFGTRFFIYGLYYVEVCSLCPYFGEWFYHKSMLDFIKCFFYIY